MATAASAEDGTGKAVGWVWERSAKWLRQNLPPAVPAPASADDRDGGGSKWLRTRVGGEPGELWQQAQDLIRTGCVHPGTAALAGNGDGPPIDEAAVHRQNLDAVIASCQLLRRALEPNALQQPQPQQQPPQQQQPQPPQPDPSSYGWASLEAPIFPAHAPGQQPLWGGDDQASFQSAIAQQVLDAASDSTCTSDSSELDSASPWEPLSVAFEGGLEEQAGHGMQLGGPPPLPSGPPPPPYQHGSQCASCLKVFEADQYSQKLKSVCARPFSRVDRVNSTVRGFPLGHSLCMPCYKVVKKHTAGVDTSYCLARHWPDGQSSRGPCKTCTDLFTRDETLRGAEVRCRVPDCTAWLPVCDAQGKVQFVCQSCASDSSRFEQVAKRQRTIQSTGGGGGGGGGGRRSWPNAAAAGFAVLASVMCLVVFFGDQTGLWGHLRTPGIASQQVSVVVSGEWAAKICSASHRQNGAFAAAIASACRQATQAPDGAADHAYVVSCRNISSHLSVPWNDLPCPNCPLPATEVVTEYQRACSSRQSCEDDGTIPMMKMAADSQTKQLGSTHMVSAAMQGLFASMVMTELTAAINPFHVTNPTWKVMSSIQQLRHSFTDPVFTAEEKFGQCKACPWRGPVSHPPAGTGCVAKYEDPNTTFAVHRGTGGEEVPCSSALSEEDCTAYNTAAMKLLFKQLEVLGMGSYCKFQPPACNG